MGFSKVGYKKAQQNKLFCAAKQRKQKSNKQKLDILHTIWRSTHLISDPEAAYIIFSFPVQCNKYAGDQ